MFFLRNIPIKIRLSLQFTLFLAATIGVLVASTGYLYVQNSEQNIDNIIRVEYENIRNSIDILNQTEEGVELQEATIDKIERATDLGLLIFIFDSSGSTITTSSSIDSDIPKNKDGYFEAKIAGQSYQFYAGKHKELSIVVGMNEQLFQKNFQDLRTILFTIWVIASILSLGIGYLFSSRALSPIKKLVKEVKSVDITNTNSAQLKEQHNDDEIGMLATAFDSFIERIRETFEREKEFSQDASHELRTPLMIMRTSLELLDSNNPTDYQKEKIAMMSESVEKMERLVDSLLFLERNLDYEERINVNLSDFLRSFLPPFKLLATQKNIDLQYEEDSTFHINTNPFLLDLVFGNLLKNAIAYTDKGKVVVKIEETSIIIEDTGVGMNTKDLENVWHRFYRVEKSRNREGFGLGLAIVKKVVDSEHWKIRAESTPGKGTTISVEFVEAGK